MESTSSTASGPLARVRAWLRGDRFMEDSTAVAADPPAVPGPAATAHRPAKES
jgi:hypothetical protein